MKKKDIILLSGASTVLLIASPVAARSTNEATVNEEFQAVEENQHSQDESRVIEQGTIAHDSLVSSPEQFSPDFVSQVSVTPTAATQILYYPPNQGGNTNQKLASPLTKEGLRTVNQEVAERADVTDTPVQILHYPPNPSYQGRNRKQKLASSLTKEGGLKGVNQEVSERAEVTDTPVHPEPISSELPEFSTAELDDTSSPDSSMGQITSVSQLSDVQPADWAFQALQSLVERYGAIAGYPDGTFRGNRPMTRYEFAASLSAVLNKVTELTNAGLGDRVRQEDFQTLEKLKDDFATELANLRTRVDTLEARTAAVAAQQFSTTTRLGGEAIFGLATASGGDPPGKGETNTVLTYLSQLQLVSSFSGKDILRIGLATGNFADRGFANPNSLNTNMARLSYQAELDNQLLLNTLEYRFAAFGDRMVFTLQPVGFSLSSVLSANSPYVGAGQGAISRFGESSSIFKIGNLDAGVGFDWLVADRLRLQFAYGARNASNATEGLFSSKHSALGVQLYYKPSDRFQTGLAYVNAYSNDGRLDTFTGSYNADTSGEFNEPAQIHALNATVQWRLAPKLVFGTWGGLVVANSLKSDAITLSSTYLVSLGLYDPFGRKGDLLAVLVGQPLKLNAGFLIESEDKATSLHYEVFYRFRLSDRISITPGFFIVTNPGHISQNDDIFVGTIRTTFSF